MKLFRFVFWFLFVYVLVGFYFVVSGKASLLPLVWGALAIMGICVYYK